MDEFCRSRRRCAREIAHLGEENAEATALSVAGDTAPVHAPADHSEIVRSPRFHFLPRPDLTPDFVCCICENYNTPTFAKRKVSF